MTFSAHKDSKMWIYKRFLCPLKKKVTNVEVASPFAVQEVLHILIGWKQASPSKMFLVYFQI